MNEQKLDSQDDTVLLEQNLFFSSKVIGQPKIQWQQIQSKVDIMRVRGEFIAFIIGYLRFFVFVTQYIQLYLKNKTLQGEKSDSGANAYTK